MPGMTMFGADLELQVQVTTAGLGKPGFPSSIADQNGHIRWGCHPAHPSPHRGRSLQLLRCARKVRTDRKLTPWASEVKNARV